MTPQQPVADAHCDLLYYTSRSRKSIESPSSKQAVSIPYMREGGAAMQFFAAWVDPEDKLDPTQQFLQMADAYHRMLEGCDDIVPFSREFSPESGKIAAVLTIEGGEALGGALCNIRNFYRLGVRAMTLTWNASNELAAPAMSRLNRGLTRLGRQAIELMNEVGMAVDVAHLSDAGIDDVLRISSKPIFSSHTNARAVCEHRRSLSDKHIRAIANCGGVVCINYFPPQLTKAKKASIEDIVKHIMHVRNVGGIDSVALGSDFDGMNEYPVDMKNWSDVPKLIDALYAAGLSADEVSKIAYSNLAGYISRFY